MDTKSVSLSGSGVVARATKSSFSARDLELVKTSLKNYKYGKDLDYLLNPSAGFRTTSTNGVLTLTNWIQSNSYRGVCGELSNSLGLSLIKNPDFNSKYDVVVATGSNAKYFPQPSVHAFLLIAPKEVDIRRKLIADSLVFPEGALLADPSLGKLEVANENNTNEDGYKLCIPSFADTTSFRDVETYTGDVQLDLKPNGQAPVVLGFTKDYLPGNFRDEETLYLVFHTDDKNQIKEVNLASFNPTSGQPTFIDLSQLPTNINQVSNLQKLTDKVKVELMKK